MGSNLFAIGRIDLRSQYPLRQLRFLKDGERKDDVNNINYKQAK